MLTWVEIDLHSTDTIPKSNPTGPSLVINYMHQVRHTARDKIASSSIFGLVQYCFSEKLCRQNRLDLSLSCFLRGFVFGVFDKVVNSIFNDILTTHRS